MKTPSYDILKEYLIHCYLYYTASESIITDHEFDALCHEIAATWCDLQSPWKDFVFTLEGRMITGIKGSELGETCPAEIKRIANIRLADYKEARETFLGQE